MPALQSRSNLLGSDMGAYWAACPPTPHLLLVTARNSIRDVGAHRAIVCVGGWTGWRIEKPLVLVGYGVFPYLFAPPGFLDSRPFIYSLYSIGTCRRFQYGTAGKHAELPAGCQMRWMSRDVVVVELSATQSAIHEPWCKVWLRSMESLSCRVTMHNRLAAG